MYLLGFILGFMHGALAFYVALIYSRIRNRREPQ